MTEPTRPERQRLRRWQRIAASMLACMAGLSLLAANAPGYEDLNGLADPARPSPLAAKSLLLDVSKAGDRLVAVGEWGHVVLSDDGGETWRQARAVPRRVTLTNVHFADAQRGWAVGHDAVVLHTRDGGETWVLQHADPGLEAPLLAVRVGADGHGLAIGAFSLVLETRDGGERWVEADPPGGEGADAHLNALFEAPGGALFIAAERGEIYRSTDDGAHWARLSPPYAGSFWGGLALPDGGVLVFGMRGNAFRSDDGGESWSRVDTGTDKSLTGGIARAPGRVVLVGLGGVVLESNDGGRRFDARTLPHRRALTAVAAGAPGRLVVTGENGAQLIEAPDFPE